MNGIEGACCSPPENVIPFKIMATIGGNCVDSNGTHFAGYEFGLNWSSSEQKWISPGATGPFASVKTWCDGDENQVKATFVNECAFDQQEENIGSLCPGDSITAHFHTGGCCDDPLAALSLTFTLGVPDKSKFPPIFVPVCTGDDDPACCPEPPPEVCVDCDDECSAGSCPTPPKPKKSSDHPIRYGSGEILLRATDLETQGFGATWGHTRTFTNRLDESVNVGNGFNWQVAQWPYVITMIPVGNPVFLSISAILSFLDCMCGVLAVNAQELCGCGGNFLLTTVSIVGGCLIDIVQIIDALAALRTFRLNQLLSSPISGPRPLLPVSRAGGLMELVLLLLEEAGLGDTCLGPGSTACGEIVGNLGNQTWWDNDCQ